MTEYMHAQILRTLRELEGMRPSWREASLASLRESNRRLYGWVVRCIRRVQRATGQSNTLREYFLEGEPARQEPIPAEVSS